MLYIFNNNMDSNRLKDFEIELYENLKKLTVEDPDGCLEYIIRLVKKLENFDDLENIFKRKLQSLLGEKTDEVIDIICNFLNVKRTYGLNVDHSKKDLNIISKSNKKRLLKHKRHSEIRKLNGKPSVINSRLGNSSMSRLKWNDIAKSLRSTATTRRLDIPCSEYLEKGMCMNGDTCKFNHGKAALVKPRLVKMNSIYDTTNHHSSLATRSVFSGSSTFLLAAENNNNCHDNNRSDTDTEAINLSPRSTGSGNSAAQFLSYSPPKVFEPPTIFDSPLWYKELGYLVEESFSDHSTTKTMSSSSLSPSRKRYHCVLVSNIPPELNRIGVLNKHFRKFGVLRNIEVHYRGKENQALVQFRLIKDAEMANHSVEAILGNRFIKTRWLGRKDCKKRDVSSSGLKKRHGRKRTKRRRSLESSKSRSPLQDRSRSHSSQLEDGIVRYQNIRTGWNDNENNDENCSERTRRKRRKKEKKKKKSSKRRKISNRREGRRQSKTSSMSKCNSQTSHITEISTRNGSTRLRSCSNSCSNLSVRSRCHTGSSEEPVRTDPYLNISNVKLEKEICESNHTYQSDYVAMDTSESMLLPTAKTTCPSFSSSSSSLVTTSLMSTMSAVTPVSIEATKVVGTMELSSITSIELEPDLKLEKALEDSDVESVKSDDGFGHTKRKVLLQHRRLRLRQEKAKNSATSKFQRLSDSLNHYRTVLQQLLVEFKSADKIKKSILVPNIKENHARFLELKKLCDEKRRQQQQEQMKRKVVVTTEITTESVLIEGTPVQDVLSVLPENENGNKNGEDNQNDRVETEINRLGSTIEDCLRVSNQNTTCSQDHFSEQGQGQTRDLDKFGSTSLFISVPSNVVLYLEQIQHKIGTRLVIDSVDMIACTDSNVIYAVSMDTELSAKQALEILTSKKDASWTVTATQPLSRETDSF